jgi:MFS family permease
MLAGDVNSNPLRTLRLHRDFRRLWFSAVVSDIGTWMQAVTVTVLVATTSKSAAATALVYSALFLPQAVCAPLGGLLADRFDRRHVAVTVLVVQAGLAGVLALFISQGLRAPLALAGFVAIQGCANAIGQPAYAAMIPLLVPRSDLYPAVSLGSVSWNAGRILGPLLAAVTAAVWGPAATIAANAVSFVVMAGVLFSIRRPLRGGGHVELRQLRRELVSAARFIWRTPSLKLMLLAVALLQATFPTMFSLVPLYAKAVGGGAHLPQEIYAAIGVGAMIVALSASGLARYFGRAKVLVALVLGGALSMLVASQLHGPVAALAVAFAFGATATPGFVLIGGVVQRDAPEALRGRIISIQGAMVGLVFGIMAPVSGWLADQFWGLRTQLVVSGVVLAAVVIGAVVLHPEWAAFIDGNDPLPTRQELRAERIPA